ncbi:hypothetical protein CFP56_014543 [Quercus suber]|uniref:DUF7950 domain-containing protein n=1 Tax=Quercus suber TaxID=58331 RepID=A0AAW0M4Q7_QUESU
MDGRGGCCIARYGANGVYDMSKMDMIMLRLSPPAEKKEAAARANLPVLLSFDGKNNNSNNQVGFWSSDRTVVMGVGSCVIVECVNDTWTYDTCGKERSSITLPCDVWRMDGGGFAWRLDVKAALSLGR